MQISVTETLTEFEKEQDTLVITDQLSFLNSVPFSRYPLLQGILLADNPDSAAFPDACEVWPLMESDALRLRRFRTWIRYFSEQFNSWLYQNFLMSMTLPAFITKTASLINITAISHGSIFSIMNALMGICLCGNGFQSRCVIDFSFCASGEQNRKEMYSRRSCYKNR